MKKILTLIVLVVVLAALAVTNPSREDHVVAVNQVVSSTIKQNMQSDNAVLNLVGKVGSMLGSAVAGNVVDDKLEYCNYYLFSLSRAEIDGKNYYLSVGILGHAITTFNEEDLKDAVNSGIDNLLK